MELTMDHLNIIITKIQSRILESKSRNTILSIGTAVSLVILYSAYDKIAKPPKNLRHIRHVNFLSYLLRMVQKKPLGQISRELTVPLLDPKTGEMYLKRDRLGWTVNIANPEAAKTFFLKTDLYPKASFTHQSGTLFHDFLGDGNILFANSKTEWMKHRKLANPAFHRSMPVKLFAQLSHKVFKVIDEKIEQPILITDMMERFTLDAIGLAGFDFDFNSILDRNSEWVDNYAQIKYGLSQPVFFLFPWLEKNFLWLFPGRREQHKQMQKYHKMLEGIITKKRLTLKRQYQQNNGQGLDDDAEKDLLTLMLESELSGEGILTDEELKSDLNVFFLAGHDTTANALSFAIHALARDPALQQRARDEAIAVLGDAPEDVYPTLDDIKKFDFISQIMKENLRLHGPATGGLPRRVAEDTELGGHFLPKGTPVVVNIYDTHHNPHVWKDPERFDADRFAPGGEAEQHVRGGMAWIPFYSGQRMCIGMNFSINEQKVMLPNLLRKYEWWLPEDSIHKENVITGTVGILSPKDLKIVFKRRY
ncbi:cytochrome P450 [Halteromyces radiatus]|uniref:cytochrome P450 n=1 Tax=Halteromyces radiatus TaxID=101107 RepID=UPI00221ED7DA|nr:cytochrome P450 [Halteromyces radiatus]KAI8093090.1 cytochrome P450 [Halteromyces radiatus]